MMGWVDFIASSSSLGRAVASYALPSLIRQVNRYRHGRGFGVHSPFAYRLITEVLHEKLPYYDYDRVTGRRDRLLYRLAAYFRPRAVCAPGPAARVVQLAEPAAVAAPLSAADFLVVDGEVAPNEVGDALRRGAIVYVTGRHRPLLEALIPVLADMDHGMVFDNERDLALIVPSPHLPFQVFKASF